ncbi:MAG: hypothetical protein BGO55_08835 [Sphingobacteriales bacterium 50-39]|nr:DUF4138 domain-containing protein [Sphingobacteriales bacterium]OJW59367.1 MAG: hypothetical protein BGO55_08835 [Sphingobacteriales bacterium 50-39]
MKQLLFLFFAVVVTTGYAQVLPPPQPIVLEPLVVQVSINKVTNLVFHHRIMSVEVGSQEITASQVNDTALALQSSTRSFPETNLSVYAGDGRLYSFILIYADSPAHTSFLISWKDTTAFTELEEAEPLTEAAVQQTSADALAASHFLSRHSSDEFGVSLTLKSLYVRSTLFFFVFNLENETGVDYDVLRWHFSIRDKKRGKRTAVQEVDLTPVYLSKDAYHAGFRSNHLLVVALPKFTVPRKKYCLISLLEKDGGRNLQLRLRNNTLIKARQL